VNTTPGPMPRRRATRGQIAAVSFAIAAVLGLCYMAGAIAFNGGAEHQTVPVPAPTSGLAESPTPSPEPSRTPAAEPEPTEASQPEPQPEPATEAPPPPPETDPRFGTCAEAIAAGYGPYVRGQDPEYDWYTDRDSDGVVCER